MCVVRVSCYLCPLLTLSTYIQKISPSLIREHRDTSPQANASTVYNIAIMKLSMTAMAILWSWAFGLGPMNFIQTSSPVAGPVYPDCLRFYQAKPGDSCQSIADAHSITLLDFIWMNAGHGSQHTCANVNVRAGEWYCVKGGELSSTASLPSASQYANNVVDKRRMIPLLSYQTVAAVCL
ncbi:putative class V chitinase [Colletotrichum chrysophilum]|uniref:Class V chitinase n=1 Tax=Colletotrichum chrysophilum TaxID=1836956 RepID=A0AAD9AAB4_9PEZI|nr:putative class V chitinase [Colletotrichum chrysophilum]